MTKKGLYKKHSIKHPLLEGFYRYLRADLGNMKSKQEVENVARFMRYMDPKEPSLLFVREVEKVREYFNVLTETHLSKQTVLNYWKSLKRFMKYTVTSTSLHTKDKSLYSDCRDFMGPLDGIRAGMSKKVKKGTMVTGRESCRKTVWRSWVWLLRISWRLWGNSRVQKPFQGMSLRRTTAFSCCIIWRRSSSSSSSSVPVS